MGGRSQRLICAGKSENIDPVTSGLRFGHPMSQSSNTGDAASAKASTPVSSGSDDASEYVTLDEIDTSGPPKPKSPVPVLPRAVARASVRDEDIQRVKTPTKVAQPPKSSPKQSPVVSEKEKPSAEPARVSPAVSVASSVCATHNFFLFLSRQRSWHFKWELFFSFTMRLEGWS